MAQVNKCLKGLFIAFNSLFLVLAGILIALSESLRKSGVSFGDLWKFYIVGGVTAGIALLGIHGVKNSQICLLITYSVLLCAAMILSLYNGVTLAVHRPMIINMKDISNDELTFYDGALGAEFGTAVAMVIGIIMAATLSRQIHKEQARGVSNEGFIHRERAV